MKIDLTEEEIIYLLEMCQELERAILRELNRNPCSIVRKDHDNINSLINKLSAEKCEK